VTPLEDEVGDEARAERLAASAIRRFVRYLELLRAREGETSEVLDIRVEVDTTDVDESEANEIVIDDIPPDDLPSDILAAAEAADAEAEQEASTQGSGRRRDLVIPDDPTVLSHLLSGIVQIELPRRQALLEAPTTTERLEALIRLLDREVLLLAARLRLFTPDPRLARGLRRS